jgi:hypothetical protein
LELRVQERAVDIGRQQANARLGKLHCCNFNIQPALDFALPKA